MHSGKKFKTVLGDISFDKKGDITGYIVAGKTEGPLRALHLEEGPGRQAQLFREPVMSGRD